MEANRLPDRLTIQQASRQPGLPEAASPRPEKRTWHVVIPCALARVGFVFAGHCVDDLLALVIVNVGISATKTPLWAVPS